MYEGRLLQVRKSGACAGGFSRWGAEENDNTKPLMNPIICCTRVHLLNIQFFYLDASSVC